MDAVRRNTSSAQVEQVGMNDVMKFAAILMMALQCFPAGAQQEAKTQVNRTPWHAALDAGVEQEQVAFLSRGTAAEAERFTIRRPSIREQPLWCCMGHLRRRKICRSTSTSSRSFLRSVSRCLCTTGAAVRANTSFQVLAEDGLAARNALAGNPHVDGARIGYWGISQGGWLALAAAAIDPKAAFAISVSAPMTTPDIQMNFAVENILRIHGYGPEEVATALHARGAVDDYLRGKLDRASAERALNAARQRPWFPLIYMDDTVGNPETSSLAETDAIRPDGEAG